MVQPLQLVESQIPRCLDLEECALPRLRDRGRAAVAELGRRQPPLVAGQGRPGQGRGGLGRPEPLRSLHSQQARGAARAEGLRQGQDHLPHGVRLAVERRGLAEGCLPEVLEAGRDRGDEHRTEGRVLGRVHGGPLHPRLPDLGEGDAGPRLVVQERALLGPHRRALERRRQRAGGPARRRPHRLQHEVPELREHRAHLPRVQSSPARER
mmetsp:Transcript_18039/g.56783  ORF Transcript_18039/g.56783 Transcript_18039/m.56783 type:complete len:210 (-) Transcript_18039:775-1404(-)